MDLDAQAQSCEKAIQEIHNALQVKPTKGKKAAGDKASEPVRQVQACERAFHHAKNCIDSYKLEMRSLPMADQGPHQNTLKSMEDSLKSCKAQIEWKRLDAEKESRPSNARA